MCVNSYNSRQHCRRKKKKKRPSFSTLDAHIGTTFPHNVKTVRKSRFQFPGVEWTNIDFDFVISQLYSTYILIAT